MFMVFFITRITHALLLFLVLSSPLSPPQPDQTQLAVGHSRVASKVGIDVQKAARAVPMAALWLVEVKLPAVLAVALLPDCKDLRLGLCPAGRELPAPGLELLGGGVFALQVEEWVASFALRLSLHPLFKRSALALFPLSPLHRLLFSACLLLVKGEAHTAVLVPGDLGHDGAQLGEAGAGHAVVHQLVLGQQVWACLCQEVGWGEVR